MKDCPALESVRRHDLCHLLYGDNLSILEVLPLPVSSSDSVTKPTAGSIWIKSG